MVANTIDGLRILTWIWYHYCFYRSIWTHCQTVIAAHLIWSPLGSFLLRFLPLYKLPGFGEFLQMTEDGVDFGFPVWQGSSGELFKPFLLCYFPWCSATDLYQCVRSSVQSLPKLPIHLTQIPSDLPTFWSNYLIARNWIDIRLDVLQIF